MENDDGGMILNFAVSAPQRAAKKGRLNSKAQSFKKLARADAKSRGQKYRPQLLKRQLRDQTTAAKGDAHVSATAAPNSSLKGYSLPVTKSTKDVAANPEKPEASRVKADASLSENRGSEKAGTSRRLAGKAVLSDLGRPFERHNKAKNKGDTQANSGIKHGSHQARQTAAKEARLVSDIVEPRDTGGATEHAGDNTEEANDIREAMDLLMRRDASAQEGLPDHEESASSKEPGVVVFSTDTRPTKRRKVPTAGPTHVAVGPAGRTQDPVQDLPQVKRNKSINPARRLGETARPSVSMPASTRGDLFGAVDSSTFKGLGLAPSLADHLEAINFAVPTRIQQAVLPAMLARRDILASAPTGSGKTLAYVAPIVDYIQGKEPRVSRESGTHAIVVAPTRELCLQILDVLSLVLRRYHWLVPGAVYGGESRQSEKARLRKGITVLVATPGRLLDHLQNTEAFDARRLRFLVLDEADRLLDQGFEQKIADILQILDERSTDERQTALFSATLHDKLGALATLSLLNPVSLGFSVKSQGSELVIAEESEKKVGGVLQYELPKQLKQHFLEVPCKLRLVALIALLRAKVAPSKRQGPGSSGKVVVFLSTCSGVDFHHTLLTKHLTQELGGPISSRLFKLHGQLDQAERTATFLDFTKGAEGILVCTDVAARGLDFSAVSTIVQYDPPGEPSEYVHRAGRSARMGQAGEALLFLLPTEVDYLPLLARHGVKLNSLPLDPVLATLPNFATATDTLMNIISHDEELMAMAASAYRSYVRAYTAHPTLVKEIFHIKKLHLGHVADSFGLRDPPSAFSKGKKQQPSRRKFASKNNMARRGKS